MRTGGHTAFPVYAGIVWQKKIHETVLYLPVREAQGVHPEPPVILLYSKITALVNHRDRVVVGEDAVENVVVGLYMGHLLQIVVALLQEFDKVGRCPGLEPVAPVTPGLERVQKTERVVYPDTVRAEMIAVVVLLELRARLFVGLPVRPGKFLDVFRKIIQKLLFTYGGCSGR